MLDDTQRNDLDADLPPPWSSPPGELGYQDCGWCHRAIHRPALPCSVRPVSGLAEMATVPGLGQRCQWELLTRDAGSVYPPRDAERSAGMGKGRKA